MALHRGLPGKYVLAVLTMSARNHRKKEKKAPQNLRPVNKNLKTLCLLLPDWDERKLLLLSPKVKRETFLSHTSR